MAQPNALNTKMRELHRYLGFFLAGIMAVYAISGIILIFRETDFLKKIEIIEKTIAPNVPKDELAKALEIRRLEVNKVEGSTYFFKEGQYDSSTGKATITKKSLPRVIEKMTHLHKATTNDPLYYLNIFFGLSLFFFVLSSFWMFLPQSPLFKKGLYFTAAGVILTLIMLFL